MKPSTTDTLRNDRIAGLCLIVAGALTVLAMKHHPTGIHGSSSGDFVHGSMIALLAIRAFGFFHFACRRGFTRPAVLAGTIAYALALVANVGAATINGFVVPALATHSGAVDHDVFLFAWELNQALARLGVYATSVAFVHWSLVFVTSAGWANRCVGIAGIGAGALPAAFLLAGAANMNLHTAFIVYSGHAAFAILVGTQLLRRDDPQIGERPGPRVT